MKRKFILSLILVLLAISSSDLFADSFIIKLYYLDGEHSKDSWSSETNVKIDGSQITYTKSWSGSAKGRNKDISKSCVLSDDKVAAIQKIILDNKLLVKDSAEDKSEKYKSFERFINIGLDISFVEALGRIRINGDIDQLKDQDIYIRAMKLIDCINESAENC